MEKSPEVEAAQPEGAPPKSTFTPKQQRFIEAYAGNATEAARLAGYQGDDNVLGVTASRLLSNAKILHAIQSREETTITGLIATREERQAFWTQVMNDPVAEMKDRLKAAELLGKSQADFTEKLEHSGPGGKAIQFSDHEAAAKLAAILDAAKNRKGGDPA